MKKLVSASEIKAAAEEGQKVFCVDCHTIITPAAKDLARELGVEFATVSPDSASSVSTDACFPYKKDRGKTIDPEMIYQVVKAIFANKLLATGQESDSPFITDGNTNNGLKIVRGRSVKYDNFDTGNPGTKVAYREVVSKYDSQMSAGFLTIEKSSFEWELCYEEIDIILEGSLAITVDGETYHAHQGDVIFVPKGTKVTWSSADYVKFFYVTYPANWADLMAQH